MLLFFDMSLIEYIYQYLSINIFLFFSETLLKKSLIYPVNSSYSSSFSMVLLLGIHSSNSLKNTSKLESLFLALFFSYLLIASCLVILPKNNFNILGLAVGMEFHVL